MKTLIKKIQRHEAAWTMNPPSTGPKIGPKIIGVLTIAITRPTFSGPAVLTSSVDISGVIIPALKPCNNRKTIKLVTLQLIPARIEVIPNKITAPIKIFFPLK